MTDIKSKPKAQPRPPIVVILGHVDHGKTKILDTIRKSNVIEKEAGGITQHIGAYQAKVVSDKAERLITFIDTPGHEAFSAMRSRGAKVADIAVLVVAADEGVRPQTIEAISHIKKAGVALVVAINKIDKKEANPKKVKKELLEKKVVLEEQGGNVPCVLVSAMTGQGIDDLLETLLLVADVEELRGYPNKRASGVVIESRLDPQRGATATLLIRDGFLRLNDPIVAGSSFGRIKTLEDFQFSPLKEAFPSWPVIVTGFNEVPSVGTRFSVKKSLEKAKKQAEEFASKRRKGEGRVLLIAPKKKVLNLVLKVDVRGSLEAIKEVLETIPSEEVVVRILKSEVGNITESDVKLALSGRGAIIGFRVKADSFASALAERQGVKILLFDVIYELAQGVRDLLSRMLEPEIKRNDLGKVRILAIFKKDKARMIIGGKVSSGEVKKGALADVFRDEEKIGKGKIVQLQQAKKDVTEIGKGKECGILFEGDAEIEKGDVLEIYEEERKKREI